MEIPKNHNYGTLFTEIKTTLSRNWISTANNFCQRMRGLPFEKQLPLIQDFVDVLNILFIDSRRAIMKKPSFLKDSSAVHETEILAIKKLHLIEQKLPWDRNGVLLYFIKKVLKEVLFRIRRQRVKGIEPDYSPLDVYCLTQICYELTNVEEEAQIVAFYELISQQRG